MRTLPAIAVALVALLAPPAMAVDYSTAPFSATTHPDLFGQAPTFMPDGRVVHAKNFAGDDEHQVYVSNLDGSDEFCVTCPREPGPDMPKPPNGVPAPRPQGDWILFHSWDERVFRLGGPGFGGLGSALYVVRPDGSEVAQLTGFDPGAGEGVDDYHAYWSPDGKQIVWAHLNWNFVNNGGDGKWDIRVADFKDDGTGPRLENVQVVRPANGHYYETQWWAPDGSGFLYTESWGTTLNLELFFCRLVVEGEKTRCDVERLTNNSAWDEQALFTPDMKSVIFMSTRDHPGFFNTFAQLAETAGLRTDEDYLLILPLFEAGFLQPIGAEATDLYELNLETQAVRRLTKTGDDGWIVPEFTWDPTNRFLMWTEARYPDGLRMPFPPDPVKDIQELADYLRNAEPPPTPTPGALEALPIDRRTQIGRFGTKKQKRAR